MIQHNFINPFPIGCFPFIQVNHIWLVLSKIWLRILNYIFHDSSWPLLLLIFKATFVKHKSLGKKNIGFMELTPQTSSTMICKLSLMLFYLTRWHKGVQGPHGPVSSCFNCFFRTWKEVSSYSCTIPCIINSNLLCYMCVFRIITHYVDHWPGYEWIYLVLYVIHLFYFIFIISLKLKCFITELGSEMYSMSF